MNAPGYPVPRARVAFSGGAQRTLIGAFGITPVSGEWMGTSVIGDSLAMAKAKWNWAQIEAGS